MSVVLILLIASLTMAAGFLGAFIWSVKTGQFDDDYTPSVRMLFEDHLKEKKQENSLHQNQNGTTESRNA